MWQYVLGVFVAVAAAGCGPSAEERAARRQAAAAESAARDKLAQEAEERRVAAAARAEMQAEEQRRENERQRRQAVEVESGRAALRGQLAQTTERAKVLCSENSNQQVLDQISDDQARFRSEMEKLGLDVDSKGLITSTNLRNVSPSEMARIDARQLESDLAHMKQRFNRDLERIEACNVVRKRILLLQAALEGDKKSLAILESGGPSPSSQVRMK